MTIALNVNIWKKLLTLIWFCISLCRWLFMSSWLSKVSLHPTAWKAHGTRVSGADDASGWLCSHTAMCASKSSGVTFTLQPGISRDSINYWIIYDINLVYLSYLGHRHKWIKNQLQQFKILQVSIKFLWDDARDHYLYTKYLPEKQDVKITDDNAELRSTAIYFYGSRQEVVYQILSDLCIWIICSSLTGTAFIRIEDG